MTSCLLSTHDSEACSESEQLFQLKCDYAHSEIDEWQMPAEEHMKHLAACSKISSRNRQPGLTLVELITVLVIVSVLVVVAAPSLQSLMRNNQMTAQANRLISALHLARSEAVKRNSEVEVCGSSNGKACDGQWDEGWIVKLKEPADDGTTVLRSGDFEEGTSLETDVNEITYQGDGVAKVSGEQPKAKIVLVNASYKREVSVSAGGSVSSCAGECEE